jgi:O-antigen/teichoic acid export membrane protein
MSRLIRNIRFSFIEQAILSLHIFVSLALIRYLGPEQYGVYSYYLSLAGIASVLTFSGFSSLYVREIARPPRNEDLTSALLLLNFFGALLTTAALFVYYAIYAGSDRLSPVLMAFTAVSSFACLKNTLRDFFVARQDLGIATVLNLSLFGVSMALKVGGIVTGQPLAFFFFLFALDTVLAIIVFGTAYGWRRAVAFGDVREWTGFLFRNGWPLLLTSLSILIFMKIDQVMLYHMRTEKEVGAYASIMWLIEKTFIFIGIIMTAFFPYLSEKYRSDHEQYLRAVRVGQKLFSTVCIPIAVFFIANHEAVVTRLFGGEFAIDSSALSLLAGAMLFVYWGAINQKVLIITNALRLDLFYAGCSAIVSLVLNYLLIPRYGMIGAAAASLAAHSFYFWAQIFIRSYWRYNYYILLSVPAPLLMALASLAVSRLLGGGIILQASLYLGTYALLFTLALRVGISDEYDTISRLFFTRLMRFGRRTA